MSYNNFIIILAIKIFYLLVKNYIKIYYIYKHTAKQNYAKTSFRFSKGQALAELLKQRRWLRAEQHGTYKQKTLTVSCKGF